jgi:signal transduction histidine kinase
MTDEPRPSWDGHGPFRSLEAELQEMARVHDVALAEANTNLGRAQADAEAAQRELDGVLAALDAGILVLGPDGTVRHANPAGLRLAVGGTEGAGRPSAAILERVPRGADAEVNVAGESGDGRLLMVARRDLGGSDGSEVVLLSDITQRAREIDEHRRMEKFSEMLSALGILSHKINNPLTALLGRAQMLKAMAGTDPKVLKAAAVIEESATRIAELIRELAVVVKKGRQEAVEKVLDVGTLSPPGEGARRS